MKNILSLIAITILVTLTVTSCEKVTPEEVMAAELRRLEFHRQLDMRKEVEELRRLEIEKKEAEHADQLYKERGEQLITEVRDFGEGVYYFKNEQFGETLARFIKDNPAIKVVSVCGDSAGSAGIASNRVSRHSGYWVVTEPK